jgi:hypothetical protein
VQKTRDMIDDTLTALVSESYIRAYDEIVKLQQLAEIEEIISYKGTLLLLLLLQQLFFFFCSLYYDWFSAFELSSICCHF